MLTLVLHVELSTDVRVGCRRLRLVPGEPVRVSVDLLANPLGLALPDVERFTESGIPSTLVLSSLSQVIPPIPVPSIWGFSLEVPCLSRVRTDGADYLTIEAKLVDP